MSEALSKDLPFDTVELNQNTIESLTTYRLLGNTGLRVSPLAFGAGTFGGEWGDAWSSSKDQAKRIFNRYIEAGGNFFDTSDIYQNGQSEVWLGELLKQAANRDRMVISTKGTQNQFAGDPNGGGNGSKHIVKAVDASLKRLSTDYIDLYFLHQWDMRTPIEEVLYTFERLVQQGKILHFGLSNFPAWYVAKMQTIAEKNHFNPVSAIQNQYSLAARHSDYEHLPMCKALKIGFTAWSPLANGLLTGKYQVDAKGKLTGSGRLTETWTTDPSVANLASEKNVKLIAELLKIAQVTCRSPSQIALNWMLKHQGVTSAIIGARKLEQLEDNLLALEFHLDSEHVESLNRLSAMEPLSPYSYHTDAMQELIHSGTKVEAMF